MRLRWAAGGLAVAAAGIGAALRVGAARWRRRVVAELQAGSTLAATSRGPIEYAGAGKGAALLVLHGTPGGYDQGLRIGRLVAPAKRVIAPSRPGYLRTPLTVGRTPAEQAAAVVELLDVLAVSRAGVIGVSGGGPVAIQIALQYPERVERLVLWQAIVRRLPFDADALMVGALTGDVGAWLNLEAARLLPGLLLPAAITRDPGALARIHPVAETAFPLDLRRGGIENDAFQMRSLPDYPLSEIRAPTLVVHGAADTSVPYAQAESAAQSIPGASLVTVPNGTHETTLVSSEAIGAIWRFLNVT